MIRQFLRGTLFSLLAPVAKSIKNALPLLVAVSLILVFVGIWTYGGYWGFSDIFYSKVADNTLIPLMTFSTRLSLTLFIAFSIVLVFAYKMLSKHFAVKKEKQETEQEQAKEDKAAPHIKDQEYVLERMSATLKDSLGSRGFHYKLPWYMVIGTNESGKTSFINRSNQKFTLTEVERSAKRYNEGYSEYKVNWWASDEAIILDPDGELFMQQSSENDEKAEVTHALWEHLTDWINKVRPQRPINGVVLMIDLPALIATSNSERKALSVIMRNRIREMMEKFGARLPVYVVLNKLDLIEGFEHFYAGLDKSGRQETQGFSFDLTISIEIDDWVREFDEQYDGFIQQIEAEVFDKLASTIDKQVRESLYMFVRDMSGLKDILFQYISDILESDRFSTVPFVRGVYFSSVFQQGIPADHYQTAISKRYNIPYVIPTVGQDKKQRAFFSYDFFKKVIYPEAGLVADNSRMVATIRKQRALKFVVLAVISTVLLVGWQLNHISNKQSATTVLRVMDDFVDIKRIDDDDETGKQLLESMNLLREANYAFGDYKDAIPVLEDFGLYQGRAIGAKLDKAYSTFVTERFLPDLASKLIDELIELPEASNEGLEILRVYRMIDDQSNRDSETVERWMGAYWQKQFPNNADLQRQFIKHLQYAMKYIDPDLSKYDGLIAKKQQLFNDVPFAERVYRNFKLTATTKLNPPVDLRNEIGSAFDMVFKVSKSQSDSKGSSVMISPLFTDWAYRDYYVPRVANVIELAMVDSWVLGRKDNLNLSGADAEKLLSSVKNLYISDYINAWRLVLGKLRIVPFTDVLHAEKVLENIIGSGQPFQYLVKTVKTHSQIYPTLKDTSVVDAAKVLEDPNRAAAMKVFNEFLTLANTVEAKEDGKMPAIEESINYIRELHAYLKSISSAVDPGKVALQAVKAELTLEAVSPITTLKRAAVGLPKPLSEHFSQIADNTWKVILIAAIEELEHDWQKNVYAFYQEELASKYPFNADSDISVSLEDFESFFGREGKLQSFYDSDLKLFLKENSELLTLNNKSLVDPNFLDGLQEAWDIRSAFFDGADKMNVKFALQPLGLSRNCRTSTINIDGQLIKYAHSRANPSKLIWPNTIRESIESKLMMSTSRGSSRSLKETGDWSWFRLLDKASILARNGQVVDYQFDIPKHCSMVYRLTAEESSNPFIREPFSKFTLPETLLSQYGKINFQ